MASSSGRYCSQGKRDNRSSRKSGTLAGLTVSETSRWVTSSSGTSRGGAGVTCLLFTRVIKLSRRATASNCKRLIMRPRGRVMRRMGAEMRACGTRLFLTV